MTLPAAAPSPSALVPIKVSHPFSKTAWTAPPARPPARPPRLPARPISEDPRMTLHPRATPLRTHPTLDTLPPLHLMGRSHAVLEQRQRPEMTDVPFEERLGLLVDRESTAREARRLPTRVHQAKLRQTAGIEDIDSRHPRGLDKALMRSVAACQWGRDRYNVLLTGPTGLGKPPPRNYPCRSQRRSRHHHHGHRSPPPALWSHPPTGHHDPPCRTRPVWCGVAAAPGDTPGSCAGHQPRI